MRRYSYVALVGLFSLGVFQLQASAPAPANYPHTSAAGRRGALNQQTVNTQLARIQRVLQADFMALGATAAAGGVGFGLTQQQAATLAESVEVLEQATALLVTGAMGISTASCDQLVQILQRILQAGFLPADAVMRQQLMAAIVAYQKIDHVAAVTAKMSCLGSCGQRTPLGSGASPLVKMLAEPVLAEDPSVPEPVVLTPSPDIACAICMDSETTTAAHAVVALPCNILHKFHAGCIVVWAKREQGMGKKLTCPMCRAAFMFRDLPAAVATLFDPMLLMHYAVTEGSVEQAVIALRNGVNLKAKIGVAEDSWIHIAARNGHSALIKLLLDKGLPVNMSNKNRWTPLHCAAFYGHRDAVLLLLAHGANPSLCEKIRGWAPLHAVACSLYGGPQRTAIMELLIRNKHDLRMTCDDDKSAMDVAVQYGCCDAIDYLMKKTGKCDASFFPIQLLNAVVHDQPDVIRLLVSRGALINVPKLSLLHIAIETQAMHYSLGHYVHDVIPVLLELGSDITAESSHSILNQKRKDTLASGLNQNVTALYLAVKTDNYSAARTLLVWARDHGQLHAIIEKRGPDGLTPLLLAVSHFHSPLIDLFNEFSADFNACTQDGKTALHLAAIAGDQPCVEQLLGYGAHVIVPDHVGKTPSMYADEGGYPQLANFMRQQEDAAVAEQSSVRAATAALEADVVAGQQEEAVSVVDSVERK